MKREFLKNFQVGGQELPKEVVDAILDENSRDIDAAKAKFRDYDDLKQQLEEANRSIAGFKAMDIDGVRKAADEWKAKYEQAQRDAEAKIADMEFSTALAGAIRDAKGRSVKAVAAMLDLDALKASKNRDGDMKAALQALKEESGYLFESEPSPPPYAPGTGTGGITGQDPEIAAIRAAAGV